MRRRRCSSPFSSFWCTSLPRLTRGNCCGSRDLRAKERPISVRTAFELMASPRVGFFVTCLVDLFRPSVGFAAVKLLEDAGCTVEVPPLQTCCGQPAFNSGDWAAAQRIARQTIEAFAEYDYVVGPSGSCMATLRKDYPELLRDD